MYQTDPFHELETEMRELAVRGKLLQQGIRRKGVISAENLNELEEVRTESEEVLGLLKEMLLSIEEGGGKVSGRIFSANEIMNRQNIVRAIESDVKELVMFCSDINQKKTTPNAFVSANTRLNESHQDDFLMAQELSQRAETKQQEEILLRLSYGLQELRETGVGISDELETHEVLLTEMDKNMTGIQARLQVANTKVDKLLNSMSNKGKICTIIVLTFVTIFLFFLHSINNVYVYTVCAFTVTTKEKIWI
ncbi:unnamed protein product [Phytomonas sp. Hart1]|nr:unnamed protein product [Phytomonas sp. Hart1]|eukprot:CCW71847.1 unnamed protein product [Phytomonas sp. isolate Hart1]